MNEKLKTLRDICVNTGRVALIMYIIISIAGVCVGVRIIAATIALIAYSINCGIEIINRENISNSIYIIILSIFNIICGIIEISF